MRYLIYSIILLAAVSCHQKKTAGSKGEEIFLESLLSKRPQFQTGSRVIFITNKSECGPCEEKVQDFYKENFGNASKVFITSPDQQYVQSYPDTIQFTYRQLASYGLIGATGAVVVINDGELTLSQLINLDQLNSLRNKIYKALNN